MSFPSRFMTEESKLLEDMFYMEMIVDDMDISRLMVFGQQLE